MRELQAKAGLLCKAVAMLALVCVIGLPGEVQAQSEVERSSWVDGNVTYIPGDDKYLYEFTVYNTTTFPGDDDDDATENVTVVDWELPLMVGPGQDWTDVVSKINSPWDYPHVGNEPKAPGVTEEHTWYYEVIDPVSGYIWETNDPNFTDGDTSGYYNIDIPYGEYDWSWTKEDDPVWQADNDVYGPDPDQ